MAVELGASVLPQLDLVVDGASGVSRIGQLLDLVVDGRRRGDRRWIARGPRGRGRRRQLLDLVVGELGGRRRGAGGVSRIGQQLDLVVDGG